MPNGRRFRKSVSHPPTFTCEAYPLPTKQEDWQPLHLIFRSANLPKLPEIHRPDYLAVLSSKTYDKAVKPSNHSIKTLAWMGDAALQLAATKAVLLGPFEDKTNPHLSAIGSGLTNNRTFSYLTASYRILDRFSPTHATSGQKRYADFFEAYIGAAWISAKETGDPDHIRDIESYLSKLYKPNVWPALESLMNGSGGVISTVRLEQDLESGSDEEVGDIAVFEVPPIHKGPKYLDPVRRKKAFSKTRQRQETQIQAGYRQHQKKAIRWEKRAPPTGRSNRPAGSSARPIVLDD